MMLDLFISFLFFVGVWLLLSKDWILIIISLGLLGHGANLFILNSGHLTEGISPIIKNGLDRFQEQNADPVPQALILTAIVIGFGMQAFLLVLFALTAHKTGGEADVLDE